MDKHLDVSAATAEPAIEPRSDNIGAILREAAEAFNGPVALISPGTFDDASPLRAYASIAVTSAAGDDLGTLCVLGLPDPLSPSDAKLATLRRLASRAATALA